MHDSSGSGDLLLVFFFCLSKCVYLLRYLKRSFARARATRHGSKSNYSNCIHTPMLHAARNHIESHAIRCVVGSGVVVELAQSFARARAPTVILYLLCFLTSAAVVRMSYSRAHNCAGVKFGASVSAWS